MQLILNAETNTGISCKMSSLDQEQVQSIAEKCILDDIKDIKKNLVNGNKENIDTSYDNVPINVDNTTDVTDNSKLNLKAEISESIPLEKINKEEPRTELAEKPLSNNYSEKITLHVEDTLLSTENEDLNCSEKISNTMLIDTCPPIKDVIDDSTPIQDKVVETSPQPNSDIKSVLGKDISYSEKLFTATIKDITVTETKINEMPPPENNDSTFTQPETNIDVDDLSSDVSKNNILPSQSIDDKSSTEETTNTSIVNLNNTPQDLVLDPCIDDAERDDNKLKTDLVDQETNQLQAVVENESKNQESIDSTKSSKITPNLSKSINDNLKQVGLSSKIEESQTIENDNTDVKTEESIGDSDVCQESELECSTKDEILNKILDESVASVKSANFDKNCNKKDAARIESEDIDSISKILSETSKDDSESISPNSAKLAINQSSVFDIDNTDLGSQNVSETMEIDLNENINNTSLKSDIIPEKNSVSDTSSQYSSDKGSQPIDRISKIESCNLSNNVGTALLTKERNEIIETNITEHSSNNGHILDDKAMSESNDLPNKVAEKFSIEGTKEVMEIDMIENSSKICETLDELPMSESSKLTNNLDEVISIKDTNELIKNDVTESENCENLNGIVIKEASKLPNKVTELLTTEGTTEVIGTDMTENLSDKDDTEVLPIKESNNSIEYNQNSNQNPSENSNSILSETSSISSKVISRPIKEAKEIIENNVTENCVHLNDNVLNETANQSNKTVAEDVSIEDTKDLLGSNVAESFNKSCEKLNETVNEIIDNVQDKETEEAVLNILEPRNEDESINLIENNKPKFCNLSNNLDILSDDEDESSKNEISKPVLSPDSKCINIDDDDDVMVIDEDIDAKLNVNSNTISHKQNVDIETSNTTTAQTNDECQNKTEDLKTQNTDKILQENNEGTETSLNIKGQTKTLPENNIKIQDKKPLLPIDFLKACKKNFAEMTRSELEEFCILKIVESVVDRSSLSEIKSKLKSLSQNVEEYKKKAVALTKQNRDLQVVLKSVQEEQKKTKGTAPITPLKITRSVGMQIVMTEPGVRRKPISGVNPVTNNARPVRNVSNQNTRAQKQVSNAQQIPVPRLIPANNSTAKAANSHLNTTNNRKTTSPSPNIPNASSAPNAANVTNTSSATNSSNGAAKSAAAIRAAEKRNRAHSVTVDLTDDEPPNKLQARNNPAQQPVRLVPPQNLLGPRQPLTQPNSSPRKVYIPISGPQGPNVRPGQIMLKAFSAPPGIRPRGTAPTLPRNPQNTVRVTRVAPVRHPAPLPDAMKQYQPPNWKALPPAPDLKLSKVENGIVISWKIEGYQEESYEEIASYQLYAYQETSAPPNTNLWKKIGDVKALPLPMACTLTQFMAGYKYYFAVRAVDVRSRLGPFSLPGSILLLSKT